jgi:hypothetical protein
MVCCFSRLAGRSGGPTPTRLPEEVRWRVTTEPDEEEVEEEEEVERIEAEERMEGEPLTTVKSSLSSSMRMEGGTAEGEERESEGWANSGEVEGGEGTVLNRLGGPQPSLTASSLC